MKTLIIIFLIVIILLSLYMIKVYQNGRLDDSDDKLHQLSIFCMNCKITERNKIRIMFQIDTYKRDRNINQEKLDVVDNNFRIRFKMAIHSLR